MGRGDSGVEIPPVVARILSGDSTSPLTREASLVRGEGVACFCGDCGKGMEASVVVRTNFPLPEILKRA